MIGEGKKSWFGRLKSGLEKSSKKLVGGIADLVVKRKLDQQTLDDLEDLLITGDLGTATAAKLTTSLSAARFDQDISSDEIKTLLAADIKAILEPVAKPLQINPEHAPHLILMCGVNGSGKTTTIGKLAKQYKSAGLSVMMVAGDTFRAAAVEQLAVWAERADCPIVTPAKPGADAAGLIFSSLEQAKAQGIDVVLADTAGRLQNRKDLMAELEKIIRVVKKMDDTAPHTVLLVMDATIGQNAHSQVEAFKKIVNVSGLVVTKLDGSAKGGVVVALAEKFKLPIHYVGVGESIDDLRDFDAGEFAASLMGIDTPAHK